MRARVNTLMLRTALVLVAASGVLLVGALSLPSDWWITGFVVAGWMLTLLLLFVWAFVDSLIDFAEFLWRHVRAYRAKRPA